MKIITTTIVGALLAVTPFAVPVVFAATATTTVTTTATTTTPTTTVTTPTATATAVIKSASSIQATLKAQIVLLMQQIKALQVQIAQIKTAQQTIVSSFTSLRSQMRVGSRGKDVKVLQKLLASDPSIYPQGLVTGYYGRLTEDAVKKFQENHGISPVGEVGPETRMLVNSFLKRATSTISRNFLRRAEGEQENATGGNRMVSVCHRTGNTGTKVSQRVARRALFSFVKRGDSVGECERERGNRGERGNMSERGRGGERGGERSGMGEQSRNNNITTSTSSFGQGSVGENASSTSDGQVNNSNMERDN